MRLWLLAGLLLSASSSAAPFVEQLTLADGRVVVVAEAVLEPRSIGSFSVRLYSGRRPEFPVDEFIDGVVLKRDGFIGAARLVDSTQGQQLELELRTAGSGNYRNFWRCGFDANRVRCQPY